VSTDSSTPRPDARTPYLAVGELFAALASPLRAAIIHRLSDAPSSVTELVNSLGISQPLASQHLKVLRSAGLVTAVREGRSLRYQLADEHVAHIFLDALAHTQEPTES